jgi:putative ABC transport system substrate-binding protein
MNRRRQLLIVLSVGALGAARVASGQQPPKTMRHVAWIGSGSITKESIETFKRQLRELGHVEGKSVAIEHHSADGKYDRLPSLIAALVKRNVDVMVTGATPATIAAKNATRTIPIVFTGVADPVGQGIVASLARPGGNITGTSLQHPETAAKTLELLKEIVPSLQRVAVLSNPSNASLPGVIREVQAAAKHLRIDTRVVGATAPEEFGKAFAEMLPQRPGGLVILSDPMFNLHMQRLAALATEHRLPAIGGNSSFPEMGGLMSYGANRLDQFVRVAVLVDKILRGAKPTDLPVEQPTKFDLVVNLATAKALGVTVPQTILVRADKVIR